MKYLLVFDVDGTLVDSERTIVRCLKEASEMFGYHIPDVRGNIGILKLGDILKRNGVPEKLVTMMIASYNECYMSSFQRDTFPIEDSAAVLEELQRNNELGILTLKSLNPTKKLLERFFGNVKFSHIVCGDTPIADKMEGLRLIMEHSGRKGEEIYYIGDRASDARSAEEVGIKWVWVSFGMGKIGDMKGKMDGQTAGSFRDILKIFNSRT